MDDLKYRAEHRDSGKGLTLYSKRSDVHRNRNHPVLTGALQAQLAHRGVLGIEVKACGVERRLQRSNTSFDEREPEQQIIMV
jgi:hypothetical protein